MFWSQFWKDNISNIGLQSSEMSIIIIVYPILIQQFLEILNLRLKTGDIFIFTTHHLLKTSNRQAVFPAVPSKAELPIILHPFRLMSYR